jgi:hypothetical protein
LASFQRRLGDWSFESPRETFSRIIYSKKSSTKSDFSVNFSAGFSSDLHMKKILLLSAVLLGAVSASQAGVRFSIGLPLPPLPLPGLVIGHRAPPVYYQAPPVCAAPPVYYGAPPVCYDAPVVVAPPVYFGFGFRDGYRYGGHYAYGGWDRHYAYGGWDRHSGYRGGHGPRR